MFHASSLTCSQIEGEGFFSPVKTCLEFCLLFVISQDLLVPSRAEAEYCSA